MKDKVTVEKQVVTLPKSGENLVTHGAFRYLRYSSHKCRNCVLARRGTCPVYGKVVMRDGVKVEILPSSQCIILEDYIDETVSDIMDMDHIIPKDIHLVAQLGRSLGFLFIANAYIAEEGLFIIDGHEMSVKEIHNQMLKVEAQVSRILDQLGLTPNARKRMGLDKKGHKKKNFAQMIIESNMKRDALKEQEDESNTTDD